MLDILILIGMCFYVANAAKKKGYSGWPFVLLMIFAWLFFGCGAGVGGMMIMGQEDDEFPFGFLIGYVLGVVLACVSTSLLIACLPSRETDDDRDDSSRRRRRRRAVDDDDDDRRDRGDRRRYDRDDDRDDRDDDRDGDRRPRRYDDR